MPVVIPSLRDAQSLLNKTVLDSDIRRHCEATQQKAIQIANLVSSKVLVNIPLVKIGALLHDIGRAQIHDITHGYIGGQILHQNGYPLSLVRIVERHVLGGFTAKEALLVGLPGRTFIPQTWEEKIVCVADKLGLFEWNEIRQPKKWIEKMDVRFSELRKRYGIHEPYETSIKRARRLAQVVASLAVRK